MPTNEDFKNHEENCSACQSGTRCEENERLVEEHLWESATGMSYGGTVTGRSRSDRPNISNRPRGDNE